MSEKREVFFEIEPTETGWCEACDEAGGKHERITYRESGDTSDEESDTLIVLCPACRSALAALLGKGAKP